MNRRQFEFDEPKRRTLVTQNEIDAYLRRRLEREEPMILPAFAGRVY